tara:strand:+ start:228 stop:1946 length:1719 start_codon:yes stop_codon:yes gene_type:complete
MTLKVLGLNSEGHDTSACIVIDGKLIAACEQERYDKAKHSKNFPNDAINDCLKIAKLKIKDIDVISSGFDPHILIRELYLKPAIKDNKRVEFLINNIERIKSIHFLEKTIQKKLNVKTKIEFNNHHLCHLASTYYPSGFQKAVVVSYDGIGESESGAFAIANKGNIKVLDVKNVYPNSFGLIYSAITFYLGWKPFCDEGIIMGLAPYGDSRKKVKGTNKTYYDFFKDIICINKKNPLEYQINKKWIAYHLKRDVWISDEFIKVFGKPKKYLNKLTEHHMNIAKALQDRLEYVVCKQLDHLQKKYKIDNLCLAGGVALNCSLNGKIKKKKIFKNIFIQPASGDAGIAYGSCLVSTLKRKKLKVKKMNNFYTGLRENEKIIKKNLIKNKIQYKKFSNNNIYNEIRKNLVNGKIIGIFRGAAEFGPRALGNRSIISKPYPSKMRDHLNKNVKFREFFRPFAPMVLNENREEFFDLNQESPHMLIACKAKNKNKKKIPAVVHVDNSCRVQTVTNETNPFFYKLIKNFYKHTGVPVILNTSFNIKGQPIVNDSLDAIKCFKKYNIDVLVLENFIIEK